MGKRVQKSPKKEVKSIKKGSGVAKKLGEDNRAPSVIPVRRSIRYGFCFSHILTDYDILDFRIKRRMN